MRQWIVLGFQKLICLCPVWASLYFIPLHITAATENQWTYNIEKSQYLNTWWHWPHFECMSFRTHEFNGWFFLHYIHAYMDWFVLISIKTAVKIDVHFLWVAVSQLSFKDRSTEINQSSFALSFNIKTLGLQWGGLNCFYIRKTHTRPKDGCVPHLKSLHNAKVP